MLLNLQKSYLALVVLLLLGVTNSFAQDNYLYVYGSVKSYESSQKMEGVTVTVTKDGNMFDTFRTGKNGKFEFNLPLGAVYDLKFSKPNLVAKKLNFDAKNIPSEDQQGGFSYNVEMSLFEEQEGLDVSILDKPIGIAKFNPNTNAIDFDADYTSSIQNQIASMMKELERVKKDAERKKEAFDGYIIKGDAAMKKSDYKEAVDNYSAAVELFPANEDANRKYNEALEKFNAENADADLENEYNALISEADGLFKGASFEDAKETYNSALDLKPGEFYPKSQVEICRKKIAELEADALAAEEERQKQEAFDALVKEAEVELAKLEFDNSIAKFEEALDLLPRNTEVPKRIIQVKKEKEAYLKKQALMADYNILIETGDASFGNEDFENALLKYQEALDLIADEPYPTKQIEAINSILKEIARKADEDKEAEARKAKLLAEFNDLIKSADQLFNSEKYKESIEDYSEALELIQGEEYPQTKIDEAQKILDEQNNALKKQEQIDAEYAAFIDAADGLFNREKWQDAKSKYTDALNVKDESYPQERVDEIIKILEKIAADSEADRLSEIADSKKLDEQYDNLITSADLAFDTDDLKKSKEDYIKARDLKPSESYPKERIVLINSQLDELERDRLALASIDDEYNRLIAEADKVFLRKDYETARRRYVKALEIKSEEEHPANRLKVIDEELAKIAEKFEEERSKEESKLAGERIERERTAKLENLEAEYNGIIKAADKHFGESNWTEAIKVYQDAVALKPTEYYPESQIDKAEQRIKEDERLASKQVERKRKEEEKEAERLAQMKEDNLEDSDYGKRATIDDSMEAEVDRFMQKARKQDIEKKNEEVYSEYTEMQSYHREWGEGSGDRVEETRDATDDLKTRQDKMKEDGDTYREIGEGQIERSRTKVNKSNERFVSGQNERVDANYENIVSAKENNEELINYDQQLELKVNKIENYREDISATENKQISKQDIRREDAQAESENYADKTNAMYTKGNEQIEDKYNSQKDYTNSIDKTNERYYNQEAKGIANEYKKINDTREYEARERQRLMEQRNTNIADIEAQKVAQHKKQDYLEKSQQDKIRANKEASLTYTLSPKKSNEVSKLAEEYPQGVTEESSTEFGGNKVIIRRIVVNGKQADDYQKVVAKWGTFYFKNGDSIPKHIWDSETNPEHD